MKDIKSTIYEIMVYINLNLFNYITLDTLSQQFAYSKYHLHRQFKTVAGVTLNAYLKRRRIETSIYFLFCNLESDISEIAEYCGFSSATYSREFKKIFNRTPKEWRNVFTKNREDSKICKNFKSFISYSDYGAPKEIKKISTIELEPMILAVKISYGNYYDQKMNEIWDEVMCCRQQNEPLFSVPINSPSVTDLGSCLYLAGFESSADFLGLSKVSLEGGSYILVDYQGLMRSLGETYTWLIKFYMPQKGLKYDYRVQLQKYSSVPDYSQKDAPISCTLYIPIRHF